MKANVALEYSSADTSSCTRQEVNKSAHNSADRAVHLLCSGYAGGSREAGIP